MPAAHSWFRTTSICLALLLEGMCSSSINVQIGAIRESLAPGPTELSLVVSAFLVAYAGLLPVAGRLVDTHDRGRVFRAGLVLFAAGCLACAAATEPWMLVAGRFVQGAGAALSAPAALALITVGLPAGATRNRAVALYGAMGAAGFSLGLVLPGFVVTSVGWRASFLVLVPIVLLVLAVTRRVDTGTAPDRAGRIAVGGAVLLTATLMVALHGIGGIGTSPGWLLAVEATAVGAGVVLLRRRGDAGGFPVELVRQRRVLSSCIGLASVFAGVLASMYVISLGLQLHDGADAAEVGLVILPQPLAFSLLSGTGARLVTRIGSPATLTAGASLIAVALVYLQASMSHLPYAAGMLPGMAMIGAGLALAFPAASIGAVDAAPAADRGTTAGLLTTSQNVGGATGIAVITALGLVPAANGSTGVGSGVTVAAVFVVAGALAAALLAARPPAMAGAPGPTPTTREQAV